MTPDQIINNFYSAPLGFHWDTCEVYDQPKYEMEDDSIYNTYNQGIGSKRIIQASSKNRKSQSSTCNKKNQRQKDR